MDDDPSWTIRQAGGGDLASLALIGGATFLETFAGVLDGQAIVEHCARAHSVETYRHYLEKGGCAWLAEVGPGGAPVGFAMLTPADLPGAAAGDIELKRIYALSRFHGSGIGGALMAVALTAAGGHRRLLLGAFAGNRRALAFYAKQGFAPIGRRQFDVGGTLYDDIILARPLGG